MADADEHWKPGSFTKNFSWGHNRGLTQLYDSIRAGFVSRVQPVPRNIFMNRVGGEFNRYIAANFFLFATRAEGGLLIVDELVFQAVTGQPGPRFDKLALFALNFSYAGRWKTSTPDQRRPAMWAHWYVRDRVAKQLDWDTTSIDANDIEKFVLNDSRYEAKTARKLATNLAFIYKVANLDELGTAKIERWWVDALFLALDRLLADSAADGKNLDESNYASVLAESGFQEIAGKRSLEKDLATRHLLRLYAACGGPERFSEEATRARTEIKLADLAKWLEPNDAAPRGAVHPSNPRILKSLPAACAMLATYAGFHVISGLEMEEFDPEAFVRQRTRAALAQLKQQGVAPTMTAQELLQITRER